MKNTLLWAIITGAILFAFFKDVKDVLASYIPNQPYSKYSFGGLVGTVQTVKGTAAVLGGYHIMSPAATICYIQFFDVATATTVTLGTTVPDLSLGFNPSSAANMPTLWNFVNGIKIAATTTRTGSTPCGTGMDVNLAYQ